MIVATGYVVDAITIICSTEYGTSRVSVILKLS